MQDMKIVSAYPRPIRLVENLWIPMADGNRLAAKMWLPVDAEQNPVPAIIDYIPYRKRDGSVLADERTFPYFAGHGYACLRIDIRGTGDSDGLFEDEYVRQEQDDGVAAIEWIAAQGWCSGKVGMIGISWGGFSALQVAARRPEPLKAIVTLCSTDDRYADDMHYMGGCLLNDTLVWGTSCFVRMALPPDPAIVGAERWREMWQARLQNMRPTLIDWVKHQRRDEFWRHGSICEDWSAIQCAVFAVGGWADGYSNAIFRMLQNLKVPRLGLVGPWGHKYPHMGVPGPAIGFLQECLRFWDHWLKGQSTGIMDEPMLRSWIQEWVTPAAHHDHRPGRWVGDPAWPSPHVREDIWGLAPHALVQGAGRSGEVSIRSPETVGVSAGEWCAYGLGGLGPEMPLDQRFEDGGSLTFDTVPLDSDLIMLGAPVLELSVRCDQPTAILAARLSDVAPDGQVARVSYGLLNLSHHEGHDRPRPLDPGRYVTARLQLNEIGYAFRQGHSIRLSLSTAYWPIAFPSPNPATLTVDTGRSRLRLPARAPQLSDDGLRTLPPPESSPPMPTTIITTGMADRSVHVDPATRFTTYTVLRNDGQVRLDPVGTTVALDKSMTYRVRDNDPTSAVTEVRYRYGVARDDWVADIAGTTKLTATKNRFILHVDADVFEQGRRIFCRSWHEEIPRDLL
jgi:uncharacterized protein